MLTAVTDVHIDRIGQQGTARSLAYPSDGVGGQASQRLTVASEDSGYHGQLQLGGVAVRAMEATSLLSRRLVARSKVCVCLIDFDFVDEDIAQKDVRAFVGALADGSWKKGV